MKEYVLSFHLVTSYAHALLVVRGQQGVEDARLGVHFQHIANLVIHVLQEPSLIPFWLPSNLMSVHSNNIRSSDKKKN